MNQHVNRRALVAAAATIASSAPAFAEVTPNSDVALLRLAVELDQLQLICNNREMELHLASEAWKAVRHVDGRWLSLDTREGRASFSAAIDALQASSDEVWAKRDAIIERIRETPAVTLVGIVAKARALRYEILPSGLRAAEIHNEFAWEAKCFETFLYELECVAGMQPSGAVAVTVHGANDQTPKDIISAQDPLIELIATRQQAEAIINDLSVQEESLAYKAASALERQTWDELCKIEVATSRQGAIAALEVALNEHASSHIDCEAAMINAALSYLRSGAV